GWKDPRLPLLATAWKRRPFTVLVGDPIGVARLPSYQTRIEPELASESAPPMRKAERAAARTGQSSRKVASPFAGTTTQGPVIPKQNGSPAQTFVGDGGM